MIALPSPAFATVLLFAETPPASGGGLSLCTGLLVVALAALLVLGRLVAELRSRVYTLENAGSSRPALTAPASTSSAATVSSSAPTSAPCPASSDSIPPEILAVIAAAIHVTLGREARIVGVTPARLDDHTWSLEGRRQIFHSHKVR